MKITLERKILENDIGKENNIIDKNVNDIWFLKEKKDIIDKNIKENYFGERFLKMILENKTISLTKTSIIFEGEKCYYWQKH